MFAMGVGVDATRAQGQDRQATRPDRDTVIVVRSDSNSAAWERALSAALMARGFSVRSPEPTPSSRDEGVALEEAEAAYQRLQPEEALEAVDGLIERAEQTGGAHLSRGDLVRLHLLGALCARALGQMEREVAFIDQTIRIAPEYVPPATDFPPSLRETYAERRQLPLQTTRLHVEGIPDRAVVFVDGTRSAYVTQLPSGRHLVRAEAPGHTGAGTAVVASGERTLVTLPLEYDPEAVFRNEASVSTSQSRDALVRAAEVAGVTVMVLHPTLDGSRANVALVSTDGTVARWSGSHAADPAVVASFLADRWDLPAQTRATMDLNPEDGDIAVWPWVVGGAVAVVVGIAAAVLTVVLSDSSPDQFDAAWTLGE